MSRGSFMPASSVVGAAYRAGHPQHQIGQPVGGVGRAGARGGRGHARRAAAGRRQAPAISRGQPVGREVGLRRAGSRRPPAASTPALAVWSWSSACGSGTRMAGRPMAASSATVEAPERAMTRWRGRDARRQVGEERRDLGRDAEPAHRRRATRADVLRARLLHDREPRRRCGCEPLDRGRHDVGHDARALAAAEHQEAERPAALRRRHRASPPPRAPPAAPDCRCASPWRRASARARARRRKLVAIAVTRGASSRLARPITAFCSWITVGNAAQRRREHRRHGRIAAEADDRGRLEAAEQAQGLQRCRGRAAPPCAPATSGSRPRTVALAMTWIARAGNVAAVARRRARRSRDRRRRRAAPAPRPAPRPETDGRRCRRRRAGRAARGRSAAIRPRLAAGASSPRAPSSSARGRSRVSASSMPMP